MKPRIHPLPTHPVHVFVVQDQQDRILSVAVCRINFRSFRTDRSYKRITGQPIPANQAIELKNHLKR